MVKGIVDILKNDAGVQAIVGENKASDKYKVYPNVCPQPEKFPYIIVKLTGKEPIECKGMVPNMHNYRYDVMSFHKNYDECENLDNAVVDALSLPEGVTTSNGVEFVDIRHLTTVDQFVSENYNLHVKVSSFIATI